MSIVETAPASTPGTTTTAAEAAAAGVTRRGWLRRLVPREYVPARTSRRCKTGSAGSPSSSSYRRLSSLLFWSKTGAAAATPSEGSRSPPPSSSYRRLASSLSRSLSQRWKRLPSLGLRAGSASAALDEVAFRVMYVVEAVVLGLALSCFFVCCGCHI
ncbi:unnamed protein product [Alopecurus aequalis]